MYKEQFVMYRSLPSNQLAKTILEDVVNTIIENNYPSNNLKYLIKKEDIDNVFDKYKGNKVYVDFDKIINNTTYTVSITEWNGDNYDYDEWMNKISIFKKCVDELHKYIYNVIVELEKVRGMYEVVTFKDKEK